MPRSARARLSWRLGQGRSSASDPARSSATRARRGGGGGGGGGEGGGGGGVAAGDVGGGAGSERVEGVEAAGEQGAERVADGLAAVAQVLGDPGRRPPRIGEEDHLDAVADLRGDRRSPQDLELIAGCVIKLS